MDARLQVPLFNPLVRRGRVRAATSSARTILGGRISLFVGATVALLTMILGAAFGSVAGYFRPVDAVLMRIMDGLMAIPTVLLAIALTVIL